MRQNKILLLTLAIAILIVGGVFYMNQPSDSAKTLRVAFPSSQVATDYEPTNIHLDYEYIFLENVFSPLVEMDEKGVIQPGIAEKADWIGDELHFVIRPGLKTQSGVPITADDVVFSLKRLLILSGNTHGNFKDLVCPTSKLKTVEEDCPEIRREGNTVILKSKERKSFLLPMLAAIDFAIIPRASVDPKTLKIINLKETSGPYYVSADDGHGNIELKLNSSHYHASNDIAETIKFIPSDTKVGGSSLKDLLDGRVDHIMTVDMAKADELLKFAKSHPDFEVHTTMKIRSVLLAFTERGLKELSGSERRYIAKQMRLAFKEVYAGVPAHEQRDEFFPSLGDGGLTEEEQRKITALNTQDGAKPKQKLKIGLIRRGNLEPWTTPIKKYLPDADYYAETNVPEFKKWTVENKMPHAFVAGTDTGFLEDINLISYTLNAGLLGLSKSERSKWLSEYMAIENKKERMNKLRQLHFQALAEPVVAPLMAAPYAALARKPWKIELSELYANNPLWLIKRH